MRGDKKQNPSPREAFLRELLTSTRDAAVVEGVDGQMLAVNPEFLNLIGWTEVYTGQPLDDLIAVWRAKVAQPQVLDDYFHHCRTVSVSVSFTELEPHPGLLLDAHCIFTRAIEGVPCRIWFFRECRTSSPAWISHEVKNPLNSVLGFAEGLGQSATQSSSSEATQTLLRGLKLSSKQLLSILADHSSPEWVNLAAFLDDISLLYQDRFRQRGLEFLVEAPDLVDLQLWFDPTRLTQILDNLLGNALEFTHRGWVALRVNRLGEFWNFIVEDSGVGIPVRRQKDLLKTDLGLGLLICRTLAQHLGGNLLLESEPGHGSKFTVSIPGMAVRSRQEKEFKISILVADDEKMIHLLVQGFLKGLPVTVLEAGDGVQAVEMWTARRPDLVLMDLRMPRLSGQEAARRIYSIDPQSSTKILAMSGVRPAEGELVGGRPLWSGYLEKPFAKQELLRFLSNFVTLIGDSKPVS